MSTYQEILFEELPGVDGDIGVITLNRPAVLNSLNHTMIHSMHAALQDWGVAHHIKAVIIKAAEGRAFCAGGDLRLTYERCVAHDTQMAQFFRDEYQLNAFIHHFPKPYIALLDGITMGGGVGISIHGSHRIATEKLLFAMPETGIGFFPDVGGTYFLPRLPGFIGYYLGLTGERLGPDDSVATGVAQCKIAHEKLPDLIHALQKERYHDDFYAAVDRVLNRFKEPVPSSPLIKQQAFINECFSAPTMEEIIQRLSDSNENICQTAIQSFAKKSPTSLKVTLHALRQGEQMIDFDACMRQEFRMTVRFLQGHDFIEGVRAVIIDKDQSPNWKPSTLTAVSDKDVSAYFEPLPEELVL